MSNFKVTQSAIREEMITALQWYTEQGLDTCMEEQAVNRLSPELSECAAPPEEREFTSPPAEEGGPPRESAPAALMDHPQNVMARARREISAADSAPPRTFLGKSEAYEEALRLAQQAATPEELARTIAAFEGIALKKTASNMVFATGNPKAQIMLVGEAPGADEDRQGVPFVGVSGQLLDRILACIGLDRAQNDPQKSIYISNILNWRPPGNRTPSPAEIDVSLPFIERHIQLISPKVLILCGGVAAKALLGREQSISRLRNMWHDYVPVTRALAKGAAPIPAIATYHPSYLLRTPAQKKLVWADMLNLERYRQKNLL